mmetsp:Transcript_16046/g.62632  ORF Transcript_16046/g.62632 Transcript_16046/m.62632 type:complete len:313 (-) Transcript_16046:235-1173(-)
MATPAPAPAYACPAACRRSRPSRRTTAARPPRRTPRHAPSHAARSVLGVLGRVLDVLGGEAEGRVAALGLGAAVECLEAREDGLEGGVGREAGVLGADLRHDVGQARARVGKAACQLHVLDCVLLDVCVRRPLLENVEQAPVVGVGRHAVDDRERELALRQVLAVGLGSKVLARLQVDVVVADLEVDAQLRHQRNEVALALAEHRHQVDRKPEQPSRLVLDHADVLLLGGASARVAPVEVEALAAVEAQHLLQEVVGGLCAAHGRAALHGLEVHVVAAVDRPRHAVHRVRHRNAPTQRRVVLDVVDQQGGGV